MSHLNLFQKRLLALILSFVGLGALFLMNSPLFGYNPLSVGLSRFEAIPQANGMLLEWDVETEIGTAGYTIKRGEDGVFDYLIDPQTDDDLFILSEGSPTQAYSYSYTDESAVSGVTYTYQLFEITAGSSEQLQDEVTIIYQIEAKNTPVTFSGISGSAQDNNNPTSTPAVTQTTTTATTVVTSTPASVSTAPATTPVTSTALSENTGSGNTVVGSNEIPQPPAADALLQDAYPGDSTLPQVQPDAGSGGNLNDDAGDSQPSPLEPSGVEPPANENVSDVAPGVINALEAPIEEQTDLSGVKTTPIIIRGAPPAAQENPYPPLPQGQDEPYEPANSDSTRILLWMAFIVALIIFTASVVGSILLYNNRRSV
jgi:hypothetical protein